jgi:hypothetical protein
MNINVYTYTQNVGKNGFVSFRPKHVYQNLTILHEIRGQTVKKVYICICICVFMYTFGIRPKIDV